MNEQNCVSESGESSVESTFPKCKVVPVAKSPVSRANPVNTIERIVRSAETIRAIERSLAVSQHLPATIRAINRPLAVSDHLSESVRAICRPLAVSDCPSESMRAICRPLAVSDCLSESMRTACRPLAVSDCLSESMRAINRPLAVSQQLSETMSAISRLTVKPWSIGSTIPFIRRPNPALTLTPRVVPTLEEPETWPNSLRDGVEDYSLIEEKSYWLAQFDASVTDSGLRGVCRSLFKGGYYTLAVQQAYIYIANMVRERSGLADKDGADLMRAVFSPKNPVLRLNKLESRSDGNEQQGYMEIFAGTMIGIRNPRAHEHDIEDGPEEAWEMLVMANRLMRMLNRATPA